MNAQDVGKKLTQIRQQLTQPFLEQNIANDVSEDLINLTLEIAVFESDALYQKNVSQFLELLEIARKWHKPDSRMFYFITAFICFICGKYNDYLKWIDKYIKKYLKEKGQIDHDFAQINFCFLFESIGQKNPNFNPEQFLPKFYRVVRKHSLNSAFTKYLKHYISQCHRRDIIEA